MVRKRPLSSLSYHMQPPATIHEFQRHDKKRNWNIHYFLERVNEAVKLQLRNSIGLVHSPKKCRMPHVNLHANCILMVYSFTRAKCLLWREECWDAQGQEPCWGPIFHVLDHRGHVSLLGDPYQQGPFPQYRNLHLHWCGPLHATELLLAQHNAWGLEK